MFTAKTKRIGEIASDEGKKIIAELENLLTGNVNIYIDYANVKPWSTYLNWHIDIKRLKQFLDSFDNIKSIKIYAGTLTGDQNSETMIREMTKCGYDLRTKLVKIMTFSIDASSVSAQSTDLLNQFIRTSLIRKYDVATIEYLNNKFKEMNARGEYMLEDRKCNFDVEIGRDILVDHDKNHIDTYILWSGDSDFSEPLKHLLVNGKKVILFATSRRVSRELNNLCPDGLLIFDIRKIKDFICWKKEI
ncbi:MAG: NYN domain-containing protein [Patescibacteria group bacterium]